MKNKHITHAHQEVEMYKQYYRPSFNPWRFAKSILAVLLFGCSTVSHSYIRTRK